MPQVSPVLSRVVVASIAVFVALLVQVVTTAPVGATQSCVDNGPYVETVRAALVPGSMPAVDAALNLADPDAESAPIEAIRYPDEGAIWLAGGLSGDAVEAGLAAAAPVKSLGLTGPERSDPGVSDSVVRLYCGLFDREPDPFDLEYWSGRYWSGLPLASIAEAFTTSEEFIGRFGVASDEELVPILYFTILDRAPDAESIGMYLERLASGELTRGSLVVAFTDSPEYVFRTGTAAPVKPDLPYPNVGSGRRVIYTNGGGRVWLIEASGELTKTHQVTGRRGVPSVGRYRVYSESRYAWAPYDGITMEYMVRFARGEWPYGFHSIPIYPNKQPLQTKEHLGSYGSGGCVRQDWDDAEFMYEWADVGTRVIVIP